MSDNSKLVVALIVPLFFLPKINLIPIAGETAGLRVDDFVILMVLFILFAFCLVRKSVFINVLELSILLFTGLATLSVVYNGSSPFYAIRMLEYFVFFYAGIHFASRFNINHLCLTLLFAQAMVMVAQALGIVGGFTVLGYNPSTAERVIGLTAGPWEIGVVLNFIFANFLFSRRDVGFLSSFWMFIFTASLLGITGARVPFVAHLFVYGSWLISSRKRWVLQKRMFAVVFAVGVMASVIGLIFITQQGTHSLATRLTSIANIENYQMIGELVESRPNSCGREEFENSPQLELENVDPSWHIRLQKWVIVARCYASSGIGILIGTGPGEWGPAIDGGWLRLVAENGLLGALCFAMLLVFCTRINKTTRVVGIVLALNMIFIDAHIAYKVMSFFFFIVGYYYRMACKDGCRYRQYGHAMRTT